MATLNTATAKFADASAEPHHVLRIAPKTHPRDYRHRRYHHYHRHHW
jgi:hypothetical protein